MTKQEFIQTIKSLQDQSWGLFESLVDQIEVENKKDDRLPLSQEKYDNLVKKLISELNSVVKVEDEDDEEGDW
jgi:hypothetical protein